MRYDAPHSLVSSCGEALDELLCVDFNVAFHVTAEAEVEDVRCLGPCPAPTPPVADAGRDTCVCPGERSCLRGSGHDPGGGAVRFLWQQVTGPPVTLDDPTSPVTCFTSPLEPTILVFRLTVENEANASASDTVVTQVSEKGCNGTNTLLLLILVLLGLSAFDQQDHYRDGNFCDCSTVTVDSRLTPAVDCSPTCWVNPNLDGVDCY